MFVDRQWGLLFACLFVCFMTTPTPPTQHVNDMGDIPGLSEDLAAQKENAARTFAFKAFRCYHLAESYVVMRKWAEAMGLLDRALEHVGQTLEQYRELKVGTEEVHKIDKVRRRVCAQGLFR